MLKVEGGGSWKILYQVSGFWGGWLENIRTLPVGGDPEGRTTSSTAFVTGIKDPLITKIVITGEVLSLSADGAYQCHGS